MAPLRNTIHRLRHVLKWPPSLVRKPCLSAIVCPVGVCVCVWSMRCGVSRVSQLRTTKQVCTHSTLCVSRRATELSAVAHNAHCANQRNEKCLRAGKIKRQVSCADAAGSTTAAKTRPAAADNRTRSPAECNTTAARRLGRSPLPTSGGIGDGRRHLCAEESAAPQTRRLNAARLQQRAQQMHSQRVGRSSGGRSRRVCRALARAAHQTSTGSKLTVS